MSSWYEPIIESGYLPDFVLREGIRYLLTQRLSEWQYLTQSELLSKKLEFIQGLKQLPIAIHTKEANEQHYEVPTEFMQLAMGSHMKYSCCYFEKNDDLNQAEINMFELYCERAELRDGQTVLDLGCGWGSLSLYLAQKYSSSQIVAVSNSASQKAFIDQQAEQKGLTNLSVLTCDISVFEPNDKYDRIVSIEMLEHVKNYQLLFERISNWLKDDGLFFCHVFSHKQCPYHFETQDSNSWMARYFFIAGGQMPSDDLFLYFQQNLTVVNHWRVSGHHYAQTSACWLKNMDERKEEGIRLLKKVYGSDKEAHIWFQRWRIFYMAVEELFGFAKGEEWGVVHYLFRKK